ncbi:hypothetical protein ACLOJK_037968, partial [Asimina triloba]
SPSSVDGKSSQQPSGLSAQDPEIHQRMSSAPRTGDLHLSAPSFIGIAPRFARPIGVSDCPNLARSATASELKMTLPICSLPDLSTDDACTRSSSPNLTVDQQTHLAGIRKPIFFSLPFER